MKSFCFYLKERLLVKTRALKIRKPIFHFRYQCSKFILDHNLRDMKGETGIGKNGFEGAYVLHFIFESAILRDIFK